MGTPNGIDLLNEIIKEGRGKRKEKVCFITASNFKVGKYPFYHEEFNKIIDNEIRQKVEESPENHIIQKPISLKELAARLYHVIDT